jgi:hypothetical protein
MRMVKLRSKGTAFADERIQRHGDIFKVVCRQVESGTLKVTDLNERWLNTIMPNDCDFEVVAEYEGYADWTPKQVFDKLVQASLDGKFPSMGYKDQRDVCCYRGENGRCCAFGLFIPDVFYQENFEGENAENVLSRSKEIAGCLPTFGTADFWLDIQYAHDNLAVGERNTVWNHTAFVRDLNKAFEEHVAGWNNQ